MPTGIISVEMLYAVDGLTQAGVLITGTDGRSVTVNATTVPAAIASAVETATKTLVEATFPGLSVFCHCFSVSPYSVALWIGGHGSAPPVAVWWG